MKQVVKWGIPLSLLPILVAGGFYTWDMLQQGDYGHVRMGNIPTYQQMYGQGLKDKVVEHYQRHKGKVIPAVALASLGILGGVASRRGGKDDGGWLVLEPDARDDLTLWPVDVPNSRIMDYRDDLR